MAPTMNQLAEQAELAKRYTYYCPSGYYASGSHCYPSAWYGWGRWVLAGVVVVVFIICLASLACINSRRRRRQGLAPRYGTGWMAPAPKYENNPNGYNNYAPPPPQYSQQPMGGQYTGTTFNPADGYYGGTTNHMPPPQNTYQRGTGGDAYEAPAGPPPPKAN
ncbi:hypothetical protein GQ53DRAFT_396230 [Thozetella sp. PMI_491]|nr:hypothetical protein GQ53DRAFT_396230 [Thozetella sp. PMI_491]